MKKIFIGLMLFVVFAACVAFIMRSTSSPPSNDAVAKAFNENKPDYVRVRDMFLADNSITVIAPWGVDKNDDLPGGYMPPTAEMASKRYQDYQNLLTRLEAKLVFRQPNRSGSEICMEIWRAKSGDVGRVWVCWLEDEAQATRGPIAGNVYYPLGDQWYARRD